MRNFFSEFSSPLLVLDFKKSLVTASLVLLLLLVAFSTILVKHNNRRMHDKLQKYNDAKENLNHEWNRLLLEQATWTASQRVENIANRQLQMQVPEKVEIIKP